MAGYSAATALKTRCQRSWAWMRTLDLSAMVTRLRPVASAKAKAWRTMRSTPLRVLTSTSVATSSAVSFLKLPPIITYRPSVFSRKTTKSTSSGRRPFSGQSFSWKSRTGR